MNSIQISIKDLEKILEIAKANLKESDFGSAIVIQQAKEIDTHLGSDDITVLQVSAYSECSSKEIYNNWDK